MKKAMTFFGILLFAIMSAGIESLPVWEVAALSIASAVCVLLAAVPAAKNR